MTRTTGRTLALLGFLQARPAWSGEELRGRLEVSDRTLRRDIDDLRAIGYGIEATRGRHGGYRLGPGEAVPPLTVSADEAVAIAVGLRATALGAVAGLEDASARVLAKLEQSLSPIHRQRISQVAHALLPLGIQHEGIDLGIVTTIADAIDRTRRLRLHYTSRVGQQTRRVVEPHRIVQTDLWWYILAWDLDRNGWRTLRIDRIGSPEILRETFTRREVPDDQVRSTTAQSISTSPYRHQAVVRIHAVPTTVREHFPPTVAHVEDNGDGTSTLTTGSDSPEEVVLYLGISGLDFEIVCGEALRAAAAATSRRLLQATGSGPGPNADGTIPPRAPPAASPR